MPQPAAAFGKFILTSEYLTGVEPIDQQHRNFFDIANEILALLDAPTPSVTTLDAKMALDKLGNYALYHFGTEEDYFRQCGFAGAGPHIAAHDAFRRNIQARLNEVHAIKADPTSPVGDDLRSQLKDGAVFSATWLINHILVIDKHDFAGLRDCIDGSARG